MQSFTPNYQVDLPPRRTDEVGPMFQMEPGLPSIVLRENPHIEIWWHRLRWDHRLEPNIADANHLAFIRFGIGEIALTGSKHIATPQSTKTSVLASLGLGSKEISELMQRSENTVKSNLSHALGKLGIHDRARIAPRYVQTGYYEIGMPGNELNISDDEIVMIDEIASGKVRKQKKSDLDKIGRRTGLRDREHLTMAALLSGQIRYEK